ncbi:papilin [Anopheles aquasalis]|uniref:papilin n=1 Tax=Anopheles aquasalis TaxID=42839 RepID=UPI00215B4A6E|nr:papilin [Anopheles aquasalis]
MPISAPKIPDGLPELMRGLAKSVIKENPENLYLHAAEYFENLIRERDGTLERGYQSFNAYQVYADYKEKTREKLGLAPGKQSSVSDEGDGDADDTGSGESASKTRGRTRRRRTRKPSSAEKENPVTEVQSGAVHRDGVEVERMSRRKSSELSEEAAPVSVVEEEVVRVHYNPPEAQPAARVVSAQSVEAEQAVLTVLDDEQMLDSDGVSKETEEDDEPMESVDDVGTAPSTADVTETEASVVVDSVPLQDLETCFMHANVDHLLEKHSDEPAEGAAEDLKLDDSDAKNASKQGGQDVTESAIPTDLDVMSTIKQEDGESKDGATEEAEKEGSDEVDSTNEDNAQQQSDEIPSVGEKNSSQKVVDDPPGPSPEEVKEEPCIKRQVSPTSSALPEPVEEIVEKKQDQELEEIKKVDLSQLSKDSAEALFYSLKKSALENQEEKDGPVDIVSNNEDNAVADAAAAKDENDDDNDVVVAEEPPVQPTPDDGTKRTFTDDFLDEVPITEADPGLKVASSDGEAGVEADPAAGLEPQTSLEASEKDDAFNPMVMVSMRSKQFQDQLHERETRQADEGEGVSPENLTTKRPLMRRCMTEMADLQRFDDTAQDDETTDGTSYVEEEDQFDGYYIGHIKNKILASSVSVADSDCFDPTRSPQEPANDETEVRTALETIASTDTESTIASQATIQQAGSKRSYLRKHSQNTSSNIPYASFGNAAIDQSLDEFIEREEQNKQDEAFAEAATKIQRSYRTHKKRLLRDYHSTMRTFTEDQSAESGEEYNNSAANVIQIKLDQKRDQSATGSSGLGALADGGEESDSNNASLHVPLGTGGRRPMYSLNIDDYDTVARRMTLTRGVAMQRNSTPDDDSGKSTNASTDRKSSLAGDGDGKVPVSPQPVTGEVLQDPPVVPVPEADQRAKSDEHDKENDNDGGNNSQSQPTPDEPRPQHRELGTVAVPKPIRSQTKVLSSHRVAPLDVQNLLLIARQRTMPVQIDSSVIRVLPKHMRKRISSAGMMSDGKRK